MREEQARNVVVGRAIRLPDHVRPRQIIRSRQTHTCLSRRDSLQRSTHRGIILQGEVNRLFEGECPLLICAGLCEAGLAEAYQENERDRNPSQSGTIIV